MIWSVVKYFADIIYGPTSLPGAVIAKIPVAVVAVFVLWAGRKLMKSASDEEKRFYRGMPYPYAHSMGIHMNGERMPNPWERVWSDPQRMQHPEQEPVRETVVEEAAAAQETAAVAICGTVIVQQNQVPELPSNTDPVLETTIEEEAPPL